MNTTLVAMASLYIDAPVTRVWDALTNPQIIKQYMFGTQVTTDWKVGSPIVYTGIWQGKEYEDKGKILQNEPGKLLESAFYSALTGLPDIPENYKTIRYELSPEGSGTRLTITQDNNDSAEEVSHSEQNWNSVLTEIKKILEE